MLYLLSIYQFSALTDVVCCVLSGCWWFPRSSRSPRSPRYFCKSHISSLRHIFICMSLPRCSPSSPRISSSTGSTRTERIQGIDCKIDCCLFTTSNDQLLSLLILCWWDLGFSQGTQGQKGDPGLIGPPGPPVSYLLIVSRSALNFKHFQNVDQLQYCDLLIYWWANCQKMSQ